jgi:dimethylargininase
MSVPTEQLEGNRSQSIWLDSSQTEQTKPRFAALTRAVSGNLRSCELTYRQREQIDCSRARQQFDAYCEVLRRWGINFTTLPASDSHPDCCFVQDTAVVLDEISITASMGAASRSGETKEVEKVLSRYRPIARITPPATLDGGDVVQFGDRLFVGLSRRTNGRGIEALQRIVEPYGYRVVPVTVNGGLHLTTGCGVVNDETVLLNPRWLDAGAFKNLRQLHVPETEPWAANTIRVNGAVCLEAEAQQTAELVSPFTETIEIIDISEFRKAEGSLSCLSLIFKDQFCS